MSIAVKLDAFEGPLDLLLQLIEKNKIDIYDIPIAEITDQYMEVISTLSQDKLDETSEFLVMAAYLLKLKSDMLLPQPEPEDGENPVDLRRELVERLLEYKMFKYVSYELKDRQYDAEKVMFKESTIPDEVKQYKEDVDIGELLGNVSLSKLNSIFKDLVKKQDDRIDPVRSKFGKIEKEDTNLYQIIEDLQIYGLANRHFSFKKYMESRKKKMEIIITFLAILELIKMGRITVRQDGIFDDIIVDYLADDIVVLDAFMQE
ncbi:MAG: segregation/condensation protein A [Lachnospiraceae bacterium]|jgi:segregation and condensation protein A|nr:segregation/condensation protein A [Lachnospiraceae bacterium]